jgi:hypothetical protein
LELALAGDRETDCRLEHAVTVSFLHEERVRLRDFAEAADGPAARARRAEVSVRWRAGRAQPGVEVIPSTASKVSDPMSAPVFATPEATWTVAATASAVARTARARRRFVRFSFPVIPCRSSDEVSQLEVWSTRALRSRTGVGVDELDVRPQITLWI